MSEDPPNPVGRPTKYTENIAVSICSQAAKAVSMNTICMPDDMPDSRTVFRWLANNEEFCQQYARAKEECADFIAEEILEIADDSEHDYITKTRDDGSEYEVVNHDHIQRSRLRVDARKWYAGKLRPKKYGEKVHQEHTGPDGGPIETAVQLNYVPICPPSDK